MPENRSDNPERNHTHNDQRLVIGAKRNREQREDHQEKEEEYEQGSFEKETNSLERVDEESDVESDEEENVMVLNALNFAQQFGARTLKAS